MQQQKRRGDGISRNGHRRWIIRSSGSATLWSTRRLALNQSSIWKFITSGTLPETISPWTVDPGVAQGFKGGVPTEWKNGKRWFGVILAHKSRPNEVVLNLEHLWVDLTYQRTLEQTSPHQYAGGIRKMAKFPTRGCTPASVGIPFPPIRIFCRETGNT